MQPAQTLTKDDDEEKPVKAERTEKTEKPAEAAPATPSAVDLANPALYINRETSWLAFNARVLEQARDTRWPLLERLKFLAIYSSNLDEFFMIRVSGLHEQLEAAALVEASPDGLSAREQLARIGQIIRGQLETAATLLADDLLPALSARGIRIRRLEFARRRGQAVGPQVLPPLGLPGGDAAGGRSGAPVPVPFEPVALAGGRGARPRDQGAEVRPHQGPGDPAALRPVRDLRSGSAARRRWRARLPAARAAAGRQPRRSLPRDGDLGTYPFRVTRDMDYDILEDEAHDLLSIVDREIRRRRFGACVRLEVAAGIPDRVRRLLIEKLSIDEEDVYESSGPLGLRALMSITGLARAGPARPAVRRPAPRRAAATRPISSRSSARAICCCTTPTTRSARCSRSCARRPTIPTCWRSR